MLNVSIIIPTYNDWKRLALCLEALSQQTMPQEDFEVIVVNNNTKDSPPPLFTWSTNTVLLVESKPGSYAARNAGLKIAKADIIGFTDSDCIPDRDWIKNAVDFFAMHPSCNRVAGHIDLFYQNSERLTLAELYEKVYAFKQDFAVSKGIGVTANLFCYKTLFDTVGRFNEELMSGGDTDWSLRAQAAGSQILYGRQVIVKHPARYRMEELVKKSRRLGAFYGKSKIKSLWRLFKHAVPPFKSLLQSKELSMVDRCKVLAVRYYLNLIRSSEELKIAFGKKANRE
jgi:glycosyltransferase involved in cell wall biosynthesis